MKKMRIFKCKPCDKDSENLVNDGDIVICPDCGEECVKMISSPRYFGNSTGRSPAAK
jgi:DNA-directed RNA polymerase subunit RPC12/RpoP